MIFKNHFGNLVGDFSTNLDKGSKKCISFISLLLGPNQWQSGNARDWKTGGAIFKPRSRLST